MMPASPARRPRMANTMLARIRAEDHVFPVVSPEPAEYLLMVNHGYRAAVSTDSFTPAMALSPSGKSCSQPAAHVAKTSHGVESATMGHQRFHSSRRISA